MSEALNKPNPEDDFFKSVLDHLTVPIMVVDRKGLLVYANTAAGVVIADGNLLAVVDGKVTFIPDHLDSLLKSAILDVCASQIGHAVGVGQNNLYPSVALVLPFTTNEAETVDRAILLLSNSSDINAVLFDLLRHQFNLSATEAKIAVALGTGADLKNVARDRGVTLNTLRTQLASIMEKTGIHRQAALVAFVARIKTLL